MWQEGITVAVKPAHSILPAEAVMSTGAAQRCDAPSEAAAHGMSSLIHCMQGAGRSVLQGTRGAVGPFRNTLTLQWCLGVLV